MKRRGFVKQTALTAGLIPFLGFSKSVFTPLDGSDLSVNIFSKHLQFLDYHTLGVKATEMGFAGVDLTVRPNGHVLPENVKRDLPIAINAIRNAGSDCKMITTVIEAASNPIDMAVLEVAADLDISFYRPNWFKFKQGISMEDSLLSYQKEVKNLGDLNKKLGIVGCYQNHAGTNVGASFWEIKTMLDTVEKDFFGVQYDIRHAIVEGGNSWVNGLKLLQHNIKCIVLKDFKWKEVNGKWEPFNVPIGEGMVDFVGYFKLLKTYNLKPPVSLHLEYELGGAEKGDRTLTIDKNLVYNAMKRDLAEVQRLWKIA